MSFGFSAGDFLSVASLIAKTISTLRKAGGSASQYQHLTIFLNSLRLALEQVDRLEPADGLQATVDAIKATALSCRLPLRDFLESTKKYDKGLGIGQSDGIMKDVFSKLKWVACKKLEAAMKLEAEVSAYLGSINLLLGLYQVKLKALAERKALSRYESLSTTLTNIQTQTQTVSEEVSNARTQVEEGTRAVQRDIKESSKETSQALQRFQKRCVVTVSGFLKTAGTLSEVTLQTYGKICEMYDVLHSIQSRLFEPDTRHTWFQDPMRLEDAYGRVWPVPVEYDYFMMEGALRAKFQNGRGERLVERDQWQLFDSTNPRTILSAENWEPVPAMKITMAVILPQFDDKMMCPRMKCPSKLYTEALGGGEICSTCGTWFDNLSSCLPPQHITEMDEIEEDNGEDAKLERKTSDPSTVKATRTKNKGRRRRFSHEDESNINLQVDDNDLRYLKNVLY